MTIFDEVKDLITQHLPEAEVEVSDMTGTENHFDIVVVSDLFKDKRMIEQHKMVMDILKDKLDSGEIHAVKIKTRIP